MLLWIPAFAGKTSAGSERLTGLPMGSYSRDSHRAEKKAGGLNGVWQDLD